MTQHIQHTTKLLFLLVAFFSSYTTCAPEALGQLSRPPTPTAPYTGAPTTEIDESMLNLEDLHALIAFFSQYCPELKRFSECQDALEIAKYLTSVECFKINLNHTIGPITAAPPTNFMNIPLQKIWIYQRRCDTGLGTDTSDNGNVFQEMFMLVKSLNLVTLEVHNLYPTFQMAVSFFESWVAIQNLKFVNVCSGVIRFFYQNLVF
ncbi:hypothetical protein NEDG_00196 [Nematocida displodere]|uniref:Uncharacterized protein n=1 Tax=Nematocida displodere TaxID=1805483 RepID=A0A177EJS8_9MICR|nr:hypothetical protein NEDG_00196 [Nematocida displodere]